MALPTQPFRDEHDDLLEHVEHIRSAGRRIPEAAGEERTEIIGRVLNFLRGTLVPHARAEEEVLYPEWARMVGAPEAAAPMVHDHEAIVARIDALAKADPDDVDHLQELLYGLYALIVVHFRKEEDLQLPAFDADPAVTARVLERMSAASEHAH